MLKAFTCFKKLQTESWTTCFIIFGILTASVYGVSQLPPLPKAAIPATNRVDTMVYWNTCSSETNWFFYGTTSGSRTGKQLLTVTAKLTGPNVGTLTNLIYGQRYYGVLRSTFDGKEFSPDWGEVSWFAGITNVIHPVKAVEVTWKAKTNQFYDLQLQGTGLPPRWFTVLTQKGFGSNVTYLDSDIRGSRMYRVVSTNDSPRLTITPKR